MKRPHHRNSPEEYNRRWMARVKANCTVEESGCWLWRGFTRGIGHGMTLYRNKTCSVHRMFYILHTGKNLGRWEYVCHRCDVPNCVNPDHMWIGSPAENQKDMQAKGRGFGNKQKRPGTKRPNANAPRVSITPDEIRSLLAAAGVSQVRGAKLIGISERTMRRHIAGETRMIEPAALALRALVR